MSEKVANACKQIHGAVSGLEAVSALLAKVRDVMERREGASNRVTNSIDQPVKTNFGIIYPFVTPQTDPETGFVTMIDIHLVSPSEVAMAEDTLRRIKDQLGRTLTLILELQADPSVRQGPKQ